MIRDTKSGLLFHHSTRVYLFDALTGMRKKLKFDPGLLYVGAMFHDIAPHRDVSQFKISGLRLTVRIPTKPAMHSNMKPATYSDLKPASVPI